MPPRSAIPGPAGNNPSDKLQDLASDIAGAAGPAARRGGAGAGHFGDRDDAGLDQRPVRGLRTSSSSPAAASPVSVTVPADPKRQERGGPDHRHQCGPRNRGPRRSDRGREQRVVHHAPNDGFVPGGFDRRPGHLPRRPRGRRAGLRERPAVNGPAARPQVRDRQLREHVHAGAEPLRRQSIGFSSSTTANLSASATFQLSLGIGLSGQRQFTPFLYDYNTTTGDGDRAGPRCLRRRRIRSMPPPASGRSSVSVTNGYAVLNNDGTQGTPTRPRRRIVVGLKTPVGAAAVRAVRPPYPDRPDPARSRPRAVRRPPRREPADLPRRSATPRRRCSPWSYRGT